MPIGNEGILIRVAYHAMAVVVWASCMRVEALFRAYSYNVASFLRMEIPEEPSHARVDRILGCIGRMHNAWDNTGWIRTRVVLEFCLKRGLHEQASRTIRMASTFDFASDIEFVLLRYVSQYGWDVIGDAVAQYLCCCSGRVRIPKVEAFSILFQLLPWMPIKIVLDRLTGIVQLVEHHYPDRPN